MRILVLGGTQFVGRAFVEPALRDGHELTLLHRGRTGAGLFPEVEHLLADRDGGLAVLDGRTWDVCVDVSGYLPRLVTASAEALQASIERYVYVSTISVYADLAGPRDESAPLATLEDETTEEISAAYGGLKALCERRVNAAYGDRATHVRPGYVIGPYDHTGRFPWWVRRAAAGGEMLVPTSFTRGFQAIDARDLGEFILRVTCAALPGAFNATGPVPPVTLPDMLAEAARQAGADLTLVPVDDAFLAAQGVEPRGEIPFWPGDDPMWAAWAEVEVSKALTAGLRFRPVEDTVAASLEHGGTAAGVGLAPEREAELLAAWHAR